MSYTARFLEVGAQRNRIMLASVGHWNYSRTEEAFESGGGHMHSGHPHVQKSARCKLKRGTLDTKFAKKWGHRPPGSPVPTFMEVLDKGS